MEGDRLSQFVWDWKVSQVVGFSAQNPEEYQSAEQTRTIDHSMCLQTQHNPNVTGIRTKVSKEVKWIFWKSVHWSLTDSLKYSESFMTTLNKRLSYCNLVPHQQRGTKRNKPREIRLTDCLMERNTPVTLLSFGKYPWWLLWWTMDDRLIRVPLGMGHLSSI